MGVPWQLVLGWFLLVGGFAQNLSAPGLVEEKPVGEEVLEEDLENTTRQQIASLREKGNDQIHMFTDLALRYYNEQEHPTLFAPVGDATMTVKKAVGSMVYLRLSLEKTNCTKEDVKHHDPFAMMPHHYFEMDHQPPRKKCGPLPRSEQEQLDCTFEVFIDERSVHRETVVGHDCRPIRVVDTGMFLDEDADWN